jgi:hypothetical protein
VSVTNGLEALDADLERKTTGRRRPIPKPKHQRGDNPEQRTETPPEATEEPVVVDLRQQPEATSPAPEVTPAPVLDTLPTEAPAATSPQRRRGEAPKRSTRPEPADDGPLRPAQLYLDAATDNHLRRIKAAALVEGSDVTNSAVVRRAVAELVERYDYDGIVKLLDGDPRIERGRGRPRR